MIRELRISEKIGDFIIVTMYSPLIVIFLIGSCAWGLPHALRSGYSATACWRLPVAMAHQFQDVATRFGDIARRRCGPNFSIFLAPIRAMQCFVAEAVARVEIAVVGRFYSVHLKIGGHYSAWIAAAEKMGSAGRLHCIAVQRHFRARRSTTEKGSIKTRSTRRLR